MIRRIDNRRLALAFVGIFYTIGVGIPFVLAPEQLLYRVIVDDAFYYHVLADNWLQGNGVVFNKQSPTNGFHPLYYLIVLAVQSILHGVNPPIIAMMVIGAILHAAISVNTFFALQELRDWKVGLVGGSLWLLHPMTIELSLSGMEPVLQVFFLSLLTLFYVRHEWAQPSFHRLVLVGSLLALIFLSRMDGVFVAIGITVSLFISRVGNPYTGTLTARDSDLLAGAGVAILPIAPWLAWSLNETGYLFPVSGAAIRDTEQAFDRLSHYSSDPLGGFLLEAYEAAAMVGNNLLRFVTWDTFGSIQIYGSLGLGFGALDRLVAYCVLLAGLIYEVGGIWWYVETLPTPTGIEKLDFLLIATPLTISYYVFYGFRYRHYYALSLFFVLVLMAALCFADLRNIVTSPLDGRAHLVTAPTLGILIILFGVNQIAIAGALTTSEHRHPLYQEAVYITEEVPSNATAGNFNSGYAQYYSPNRDVHNLDGVINTPAYEARKRGRIDCYVAEHDIDYIVGFAGRPSRVFENPELAVGDVLRLERLDDSGILRKDNLGAFRVHVVNSSSC